MSNEPYSETTTESYGSRLMGSIKGVVTGLALFVAAFPVLWMNEGCAVKTAKGLEEGAANVMEIDISKISPDHNGKLIHGTGQATTTQNLSDSAFGINMNAIQLERKVEMLQWKENSETKTKEKVGGSKETTTTYTYEQDWSSTLINSSNFKDPNAKTKYVNPKFMEFESKDWTAKNVNVGAYRLSPALIGQITASDPVDYTKIKVPAGIASRSTISANQIYIGDSSNPKVGDIRISHEVAEPQEVSVLGLVKNNSVGAYKTSQGTEIEILSKGNHTAAEMFSAAQDANTMKTWAIRVAGFFMFYAGIGMILRPISTLGAVLPFLGNLLSMGLGLIAGLISFVLTFLVIAVAWIFYRPLLGIGLLVVAGGVIFFLWKKKQETDAKAGPSPGTPTNPQVG